jgi:hypothetical protein
VIPSNGVRRPSRTRRGCRSGVPAWVTEATLPDSTASWQRAAHATAMGDRQVQTSTMSRPTRPRGHGRAVQCRRLERTGVPGRLRLAHARVTTAARRRIREDPRRRRSGAGAGRGRSQPQAGSGASRPRSASDSSRYLDRPGSVAGSVEVSIAQRLRKGSSALRIG